MFFHSTFKPIRDLIRSGELERALELAIELRRAHPHEAKFHRIIQRIRALLIKKEKKERKVFIDRGLKIIQDLMKAHDFEPAIQACQELLEVDPENHKVQHLLKEAKMGFIELKLKNPIQQKLEESHEYEKLYLFYQKLGAVFPEYKRLRHLIKETEHKVIAQDQERKKSFADESFKKLQQWYAEAKYDQVIKGANEVLAYTHQGSKEIQNLLKQAQKQAARVMEQETLEFMLREQMVLGKAYEKKEGRVIRV